MIFLKNLNTSQLRAVQQEPSELLIFAGPGSGKTRVLTSRIAAFVSERDFLPSRLRAVTFTRAAMDAETTYLEKVLQPKETCPTYTELLDDAITVRTIHSAKGLEFPVVVVDLIGFTPWENTPEEIEDECRVLYVAMSRAKDQLYLLGRNKQMFPNLEALITFLKVQTL